MRGKAGTILRPILQMPPIYVGGYARYPPAIYATAQVDGSFRVGIGAAAVLFTRADGLTKYKNHYQLGVVESTTEAEWAAIYAGITKSKELQENAVLIENDCIGVIGHILNRDVQLKHDYARYYRSKIIQSAGELEWVGVRWIPRTANRADDIFYEPLLTECK